MTIQRKSSHFSQKPWADREEYDLKVMTSLNAVLCPVCSEVYKEYVWHDLDKQSELFEHLQEGNSDAFSVCDPENRKDQKGCTLNFNQTHLGDIEDCLAEDDEEATE